MEEKPKKITSPEAALLKAQSYCAYQERCQQEVRDKLYSWGLRPDAVESIIASLISENYLNEERFAKAYAGGKFRIKKWGRIKIKIALKQKRVSDYSIKKGLLEIDEDDYREVLKDLLNKKQKQINEKNPIRRKYKLLQYAAAKGYEQDLILELLAEED